MAEKTRTVKKNTKAAAALKQEKEETVEVKELLKDERTHKIAGSICLLLAILFFIAFTSYLFSWEEDQDKVFKEGYKLLIGTDTKVANLMGSFGAIISHLLIYKGFGIASYLICTFFFIIGINLFFGKKIFSVVRNLKYLVVGLPLLSITAAVIMKGNDFPWGGAVGDMGRDYLYSVIGQIGTIGIIAVAFLAYVIWRFNPVFKVPSRKMFITPNETAAPAAANAELPEEEEAYDDEAETEVKADESTGSLSGNMLTGNSGIVGIQDLTPKFDDGISLTEKEEEQEQRRARVINTVILPQRKQPEPLAEAENGQEEEEEKENEIVFQHTAPTPVPVVPSSGLELEVKTVPDEVPESKPISAEEVKALKPYDSILDLRDYKYPSIDLLENHGSEKIVQDPQELENNKNQIINTLKNYDIQIQKISATVGPTVTLYEIIPAAGVRISRIKNLEDDIALSLAAALGIRIIAPIPGKGTIGIEVPNAKKSIVSMKTLLDDEI
jgi:S-DNA-T family DNA segregation ATPase FtsK/SpoIIIE